MMPECYFLRAAVPTVGCPVVQINPVQQPFIAPIAGVVNNLDGLCYAVSFEKKPISVVVLSSFPATD
jgi:hypothetical protein